MKKSVIKVVSLILCLLFVVSFTSCDKIANVEAPTPTPTEKPYEPKDAQELWQKVDGAMSEIESYESKEKATMTVFNLGYKMDVTSEGTGIYYVKKGEEFFYNSTLTKMFCKEASVDEAYENLVAYNNGKMFIRNIEGRFEQNFCSEMTYEEFLVAQSDKILGEFDVLSCTSAQYVKNDDGTWTLDFSGYTKKAINGFLKEADITEKELGTYVSDMKINVVANELFLATKMEIELVFDEESTAKPVMKFSAEYSKHNQVVPDRTMINEGSYAKVDDVRIIENVEKAVKALKNARNGSFVLDVKETITALGEQNTYTEKDTVSFGEENGGFYYNISAKLSQGTVTIKYKNGTQTVKQGSNSETVASTDDESRKFIQNLIDQVAFDDLYITAIEKSSENSFKFIVSDPNEDLYDEFFKQSNIKKIFSTQNVIVTLEGGEVKTIVSTITFEGTMLYNGKTKEVKVVNETALDIEFVSQLTAEL